MRVLGMYSWKGRFGKGWFWWGSIWFSFRGDDGRVRVFIFLGIENFCLKLNLKYNFFGSSWKGFGFWELLDFFFLKLVIFLNSGDLGFREVLGL